MIIFIKINNLYAAFFIFLLRYKKKMKRLLYFLSLILSIQILIAAFVHVSAFNLDELKFVSENCAGTESATSGSDYCDYEEFINLEIQSDDLLSGAEIPSENIQTRLIIANPSEIPTPPPRA